MLFKPLKCYFFKIRIIMFCLFIFFFYLQLRALHELGYSLQTVNIKGHTALHLACKYNHKDIVKYIVSCASRRLINMADKER